LLKKILELILVSSSHAIINTKYIIAAECKGMDPERLVGKIVVWIMLMY
jgi:hypothetical protein